MARPAKTATVETRIAALEHERDTLAAQLVELELLRETTRQQLEHARAVAVRDGSEVARNNARTAETHANEVNNEHQRLQAAMRAVDSDIAAQHAELTNAQARERQQRREALRAERDQVLEQLSANPCDVALWVRYQSLCDQDQQVAREIFGQEIFLSGNAGKNTLWPNALQVFDAWVRGLQWHIFNGKSPVKTTDDIEAYRFAHHGRDWQPPPRTVSEIFKR